MVAVFHFRLVPMGEAGFIGVDIFFVISGFLITRILLNSLEEARFSLVAFYTARLRRLMPALFVTLVLYLAAGFILFLPERLEELARETVLSQLYVVNIYFWRSINYFELNAGSVPLLHMWSLAVEEQFYVIYPLALALVFRITRRFLLAVLIAGCLASFLLGWFATGWKPEASFYLLPTRAWELLIGGILAIAAPRALQGIPAALAGGVGAALIVLAILIHTPVTPFPGWFAALPVVGSALLILGGASSPTGVVLRQPMMIWVGKISYPLYLVHWPVIILTNETFELVTLTHRLTGFVLSVGLAWVIWRFVETPVRQRRILGSTRGVALGSLWIAGLLTSIGLAGWLSGGFPERFSPEARAFLAYSGDRPNAAMGCISEPRRDILRFCPLGAENASGRVAVLGDSHALAMSGAVDMWLRDHAAGGRLYTYHGCMPLPGAGDQFCRKHNDALFDAVLSDADIQVVMLISAWRHDSRPFDGKHVEGKEADAAFGTALDRALRRLTDAGKAVVLVDPMFNSPRDVPQTLATNLEFGRNRAVDRPLAAHQAVFRVVHDLFEVAQAHPKVRRISLIDTLCDGGTCRGVLNNAPLFYDNNHIRFGNSRYFADRLSENLNPWEEFR